MSIIRGGDEKLNFFSLFLIASSVYLNSLYFKHWKELSAVNKAFSVLARNEKMKTFCFELISHSKRVLLGFQFFFILES